MSTNTLVQVKVAIAKWGDRYRNKAVERETEAQRGTYKAHAVTTILLGEAFRSPITTAESRIRDWVYNNTLPWEDGGWRVVPAKHYIEFVDGCNQRIREFNEAVENLVQRWDEAFKDAQDRIGADFDEAKFPDRFVIRSAYSAELQQRPCPPPDDYRIDGIAEAEASRIAESYKSQVDAALKGTVEDLTARMTKVLEDAGKRLATTPEKGSKFAGLIEQGKRVADEVRRLNITGDARLDAAADKLATAFFDGLSTHDLKDNDAIREAVVEKINEAKDILSVL